MKCKKQKKIDKKFDKGKFFVISLAVAMIAFSFVMALSEINFIGQTPANNSIQVSNFIIVNMSTNETGDSYAFVDFNNSLLSWYRFNNETGENATLFKDFGRLGRNGICTYNRCPFSNDSGMFSKGATFNTTMFINTTRSLNLTDYSISLWLKANTTGVTEDILTNFDGATKFSIGIRWTGGATFTIWDGTNAPSVQTTSIRDNRWYHVVAVRDVTADNLKVYIDGVQNASTTDTTTSSIETPNPLVIGARGSLAAGFNGSLDDILIFNRVLNESEIRSLYNATANKFYNNYSNLGATNFTFQGYSVNKSNSINSTNLFFVRLQSSSNPYFTNIPTPKNINYSQGFNVTFNGTGTQGNVKYTVLVSDRWQKKSFFSAYRDQHGQERIGDMIYLVQGEDPAFLVPQTNEFYGYNITSNEYTNLTATSLALPDFVWAMQSVCFKAIGTDSAILHGGRGRYNSSYSITETNRTYLFNATSGTWTLKANATFGREDMSCAVKDDSMYVMGGGDGVAGTTDMYQVQKYNYSSNTWTTLTNLTYGQFRVKGDGGSLSPNGLIYYSAGAGNITSSPAYPYLPLPVYNVIAYNTTSDTYTEIGNVTLQVSYRETEIINDEILVGVGANDHLNNNTRYFQIVNTTTGYSFIAPGRSAFLGTAGAGLSQFNNTIHVWGGTNHLGTINRNMWFYNHRVDNLFTINQSGYLTNATPNIPIGYYAIRVQINDTYANFTDFFLNVSDNVAPNKLAETVTKDGRSLTFTGTWFDDTDVDTVMLNFEGTNYPLTRNNNVYNITFNNLDIGQSYDYYWIANDTWGNNYLLSQQSYNFLTDCPSGTRSAFGIILIISAVAILGFAVFSFYSGGEFDFEDVSLGKIVVVAIGIIVCSVFFQVSAQNLGGICA